MTRGIPEEKIAEIKQAVDIVDVVSQYVQLKKQGRNFFGLCPFHNENTPSFSVSQEKQIFHCFGCGTGGNVFTFLMEIEEISFPDAVRKVAELGNVDLQIDYFPQQRDEYRLPVEQVQMLEAHEILAKFYHHILINTNEGDDALQYLKNRGFTDESIRKFQLGYSLSEWDVAVKYLEKRGFPLQLMENAGLIIKREHENTYFDRFRNRIMFPLYDEKGKIVGFSGRIINPTEDEPNEPKYLNTPETVLFNKSRLLYNYYHARTSIRKLGYVVLFEGFADVIAADRAGVSNGIAVMGTSLTDYHVHLLKRLTDTVIICLDSDDAGIEAAYRAGTLLESQAMKVKVALMPRGLDPDDYIQQYGEEKFRTDVIGNPLTWMSFKLIYLRKGKNLQNEGEKLEFIEKAMLEIAKLGNAVERDLYLQQIAEEFSLSMDTLKEQITRTLQRLERNQNRTNNPPSSNVTRTIPRKQTLLPAHVVAERKLLARMIQDEEILYRIMDMVEGFSFHIDEHQAILTYLIGYYEKGNRADTALFLQYIPDHHLRKVVSEIAMLNINSEYTEKELMDCISHVLKYPKMLMLKEKQAEQRLAERNKDFEKSKQLAQEIIELRRLLKN